MNEMSGVGAPPASAAGALSSAQVEAFARDGYLVVPGFFAADTMADLERWIEELVARPEAPGGHWVFHEADRRAAGATVLSRIENFCPFHEPLRRLLTGPRVMRSLALLLGEPAVLFKDKINFKLPGGDGFKAHQDAQAGWNRYAGFYVTALVSIDPATLENGCLEVAAGWHDKGLIGDEWTPLAGTALDQIEFTPYPTAPGDAMFFDSYAPHRSGPNLTDRPRRVLYVTYNRASEGDHRARYFADKRANFPPDIEREAGKRYVFRV